MTAGTSSNEATSADAPPSDRDRRLDEHDAPHISESIPFLRDDESARGPSDDGGDEIRERRGGAAAAGMSLAALAVVAVCLLIWLPRTGNLSDPHSPGDILDSVSTARRRNNVTLINIISNHELCDWEEEYVVDLVSPSEYAYESTILADLHPDDDDDGGITASELLVATVGRHDNPVFLVSSHPACHRLGGGESKDAFNDRMGTLTEWFERTYRRRAVVFHVSDECDDPGRTRAAVYTWYDRATVLRQYQCGDPLTSSQQVVPLGWRSGQMELIESLAKGVPEKEYTWGWAGTVKSDRDEMIDALSSRVEGGFAFRATDTERMTPEDIFDLYSRSVFVPVGRGNFVLDCFRMYSALFAGAVPVVVGPSEEIRESFSFLSNGDDPEASLPFVFAPTWEAAADRVNVLLQEDRNFLAKKTRDWWYEKSEGIREHVAAVVSATSSD